MVKKIKKWLADQLADIEYFTETVDVVSLIILIMSVILGFAGQFVPMALLWIFIVLRINQTGGKK